MKNLLFFFLTFVSVNIFGQGEQLFADGTGIDQNGNSFEWIRYGEYDWSIDNGQVVTYRDGTVIPQVIDSGEWSNLTTGAWCYYDNDPTKSKIYNWYAVAGIHDNDPNTPNKELAPDGWEMPTESSWEYLENWMISNGYNYDGSTNENKIAKSLASTDDWLTSGTEGAPGCTLNNEHINNLSGFNAYPSGQRRFTGTFEDEYNAAFFWSSSERDNTYSWPRYIYTYSAWTEGNYRPKVNGFSIRFVRDNEGLGISEKNQFNISIFPNPTNSYLFIQGSINQLTVTVYNLFGQKVLFDENTYKIDVSGLSDGVYIINLSDGVNETQRKFIKN